jgi:hypothetical protein
LLESDRTQRMTSTHFDHHHHSHNHLSNSKDRPQLAPSLSSESVSYSSLYPSYPLYSSDLEEMLPFPYIPYQYISCEYRYDVKESSQSQSQSNQPPALMSPNAAQNFTPYYMNPMPGLIPNFPELPPAPPGYVPLPPRNVPTSVSGDELFDPAPFGPGPPIVTGERLKGPRGCNLFVFHLPNEITNWDLYLLFRRHGTILSVHIMVNKSTGLSKGYGFVSFANAEDAAVAIETMDGFRLGKKRLKVQLKRMQDDNDEDDEEKQTYENNDRIKDFMVKRADSYETQIGEKNGNGKMHCVTSEDGEVRCTNGTSATASVTSDEVHEKGNENHVTPECANEEKLDGLPRGDSSKTAKPDPLMKPYAVLLQPPVKKTD